MLKDFIRFHFKILKTILSAHIVISGNSLLFCKSSLVLQFNSLHGSRPFKCSVEQLSREKIQFRREKFLSASRVLGFVSHVLTLEGCF